METIIHQQIHQQTTSKPPADNQQTTTNNKGKKEKNVKNNTEWVSPGGLNVNAWSEFEQHRKEIRKPLTKLSRTKAINKIIHLGYADQEDVINNTIQNRWTGLFPEKMKNAAYKGNDKKSKHDNAMQLIQDRVRET